MTEIVLEEPKRITRRKKPLPGMITDAPEEAKRVTQTFDDPRPEGSPKIVRHASHDGGSELDIPNDEIPFGVDLQWVINSCTGQEMSYQRSEFERKGWQPVFPQYWDARWDGRWTKKGHTGEINTGGLVLMWRPMELTMQARADEKRKADMAMQAMDRDFKTRNLPGINSDDETPGTQAKTFIKKSFESIPMPG